MQTLTVTQALQQAWAVHQQGQPDRAEVVYRKVLESQPDNSNAWCYLGIALHDQKQYRAAIDAYRRALELKPDFPVVLNNLGNSLRYDYQAEEADRCFLEAIRLKPDYFNAYKNRGTLHVWTGNLGLALESYQGALKLNPNDAELHRNLGVLYLLQKDFVRGWPEFRWRWRCPESPRPAYPRPVWNGEPLQSKTILLYSEQGIGDAVQYLRFAKILRQRGARVIVHGPAALTALLQGSDCFDQWIPQSLPIACDGVVGPVAAGSMTAGAQPLRIRFDYHCSLIDVADVLGIDATTILAEESYVRPAAYLVNYWRDQVKRWPAARLRVGIAWQGNRDFQADVFRSMPLSSLEPIAEVPGVQLISLQQGYGTEQLEQWRGATPILRLPAQVDQTSGPFMDTAAIMKHLDLILSVDTSIAHVAGALGCPTWLMLSYVPDWRWFLEETHSAWYPAHRLFRQSRQGDWSSVAQAVRQALLERVDAQPSSTSRRL